MAEYRIVFTVSAAHSKSLEKKLRDAGLADDGQIKHSFSKLHPATSRANRLSDIQTTVEDAATEVGELRDELQEWRDNLPENLQCGDKAGCLDDAIGELEQIKDSLEQIDFSNVDFPTMM